MPIAKKLVVVDFDQLKELNLTINSYIILRLVHQNADKNGIFVGTLQELGELAGLDKMTIYRIKNRLVTAGYLVEPKSQGGHFAYMRCTMLKVSEMAKKKFETKIS